MVGLGIFLNEFQIAVPAFVVVLLRVGLFVFFHARVAEELLRTELALGVLLL